MQWRWSPSRSAARGATIGGKPTCDQRHCMRGAHPLLRRPTDRLLEREKTAGGKFGQVVPTADGGELW